MRDMIGKEVNARSLVSEMEDRDIGAVFLKVKTRSSSRRQTMELIPIEDFNFTDFEGNQDVEIIEFVSKKTLHQIISRKEGAKRAEEIEAMRRDLAQNPPESPGFGYEDTPHSRKLDPREIELSIYDTMIAHPGRLNRKYNEPWEALAQSISNTMEETTNQATEALPIWGSTVNPEEVEIDPSGINWSPVDQELQENLESCFMESQEDSFNET